MQLLPYTGTAPSTVLTDTALARLLNLLAVLPHGALKFSHDIQGEGLCTASRHHLACGWFCSSCVLATFVTVTLWLLLGFELDSGLVETSSNLASVAVDASSGTALQAGGAAAAAAATAGTTATVVTTTRSSLGSALEAVRDAIQVPQALRDTACVLIRLHHCIPHPNH